MIELYLVKSESSLTGNGVLQGSFSSPLISGSTTVSTVRDTEEVRKLAKPSAPETLFKGTVKLLNRTVDVISSEPPFIEQYVRITMISINAFYRQEWMRHPCISLEVNSFQLNSFLNETKMLSHFLSFSGRQNLKKKYVHHLH